MVGGLLLCSAPAGALTQRGHSFGFAFGAVGGGEGQFVGPQGVAVRELSTSSSEVYVVDRTSKRVERFTCATSEAEQACTFASQFTVPAPEGIAVDNSVGPSSGDIYVGSMPKSEVDAIYKFSATGEQLAVMKAAKEGTTEVESFEELHGLAVDASGGLWVYHGETITALSPAAKNQFVSSLETEVACPEPGFAVAPRGEAFYVPYERFNHEEECPREAGEEGQSFVAKVDGSGQVVAQAIGGEPATAAAVELSRGTVYLDDATAVSAFGANGSEIQRFGSRSVGEGLGIAVDSSSETVYVADPGDHRVEVFGPEPSAPPTVDSLSSQNITPTSTELEAEVNPNGADTHYYFRYGTVDCTASPASCTDIPVPPGQDIGSGFVDQFQSAQLEHLQPDTTYFYGVVAENEHGRGEAAQTLNTFTTLPAAAGVLPDQRAWEMVSPPEKDGAGIEPIRREGGVTQASEDGSAISYIANAPIEGEPSGSRAPEVTQVLAARTPTEWKSQDIVTPHTAGEGFVTGEAPEYRVFSPDLSLSLVQPDLGREEPLERPPLSPEATEKTLYIRHDATCAATPSTCYEPLVTAGNDVAHSNFGEHLEFAGAASDLGHVVFESDVALTATPGAPGLYEWESGQPLQLVSVLPSGTPAPEPELGTFSGNGTPNVRHAISDDGSRTIWSEGESESAGGVTAPEHLYMHDLQSGQTLQLDAAHGVPRPQAEEAEVRFQTANADASLVFFTDTARLTKQSRLVPQRGADNPADLYECEIVEAAGAIGCNLKDLTVDLNGGEAAGVLNLVPGASEDGSVVYFVANGALAAGATPGHCKDAGDEGEPPPPGTTCNLYVYRADPQHPGQFRTTFIAALSAEDEPDWGSSNGNESNLGYVTSRVSPSGTFLAFMSDRGLTGYNNKDVNSGRPDEEVYLYDSSTRRLVCASCNPTGAPPVGVLDTQNSGEGLGLVVDRPEIWKNRWLAGSIPGWTTLELRRGIYQSRYLSDAGRLFFDAADSLAPQDTNSKEDVYEYEPAGQGGCLPASGCVALISSGTSLQESAFLDASASGNDAFFLTAQQLVAQDHDTNFDVYDARVCSGVSPCLTSTAASPRPCESSESCKPAPSPQPTPLAPSGSGNVSGAAGTASPPPGQGVLPVKGAKAKPLTRAQKLARALRACRKQPKRKRAACDSRARRKYGNRRGARPKRGKR